MMSEGDPVAELRDLLLVHAAPVDAQACPALVRYVEERSRVSAEEAPLLAWALISQVARQPDGEAKPRPHVAIKHLLGLGLDEIEADTGQTLAQIRSEGGPSKRLGYAESITVRQKVAARAGYSGTDPRPFRGDRERVTQLAEVLWDGIQEQLGSEAELRAVIASLPAGPGERAGRAWRLAAQRLRDAPWHLALFWLLVATVVIGVTVTVVTYVQFPDHSSSVDPLEARSNEQSWAPGFGPSSDVRLENSASGLVLNPVREQFGLLQGDFIEVRESEALLFGLRDLPPGEYDVTVDVRLAKSDLSIQGTANVTGAQLWLGIIPLNVPGAHGESHSVFARIAADDTSVVWSGAGVMVICDCTVGIDPDSLRLFSDAHPDGIQVDASALSNGAPIGYEDLDGVLFSGQGNAVRVVATLVVTERAWR